MREAVVLSEMERGGKECARRRCSCLRHLHRCIGRQGSSPCAQKAGGNLRNPPFAGQKLIWYFITICYHVKLFEVLRWNITGVGSSTICQLVLACLARPAGGGALAQAALDGLTTDTIIALAYAQLPIG